MPFDLSSAAPPDNAAPASGFDLSTATPAGEPGKRPVGGAAAAPATQAPPAAAAPPGAPPGEPAHPFLSALGAVMGAPARAAATLGEPAAAMASSAAAGPLSNIAGLAAIPLHAAGLTRTDPTAVQQAVQRGLTYEPRSETGRAVTSAIGAPGRLYEKGVRKIEEAVAPPATAGPARAALGYGVRGALEQLPQVLGAKGGAKAAAGIPAREAELALRAGREGPKNAIRQESQAAGYITPPEHGIKALAAGAAGKARSEKIISAHNAENAAVRLGREVGIPADTAPTKIARENAKNEAYGVYDGLVEAAGPNLAPTPSFRSSIDSSLAQVDAELARNREANRPLLPVQRLLKSFSKQEEFPTAATLKDIQRQRRFAKKDFADKHEDMGMARLGIANQLEDVFEANLARTGQQAALARFREQRVRLAQLHLLDRIADDATGTVNLAKLGQLSNTAAYRNTLTGEFRTAADFARTYQKAAQRQTGEAPPRLTVLDALFAGSAIAGAMFGHPGALGVAAGEIGGRLAVPWMAGRGMMQNRAPSYQVGPMRRGLPFALPAAGAALTAPPGSPQ